MHNLFLVYFINLYMFQALPVVLVGLFQSNQHNRQSSKKNKYQLLYTYSCTS